MLRTALASASRVAAAASAASAVRVSGVRALSACAVRATQQQQQQQPRVQQQSRVGVRAAGTAPHPSESFLSGESGMYLETMYERFVADSGSVDPSWRALFERIEGGAEPGDAIGLIDRKMLSQVAAPGAGAAASPQAQAAAVFDTARILILLRMFRVRGHLASRLDPLNLVKEQEVIELDPKYYGFTEEDMNRKFLVPAVSFDGKPTNPSGLQEATLRDLLHRYRSYYCGNIGYEFYHIHDAQQRDWLQSRIESAAKPLTTDERLWVYSHLYRAAAFETFLQQKYGGVKRFSVEGGEALLPAVEAVVERSSELGIESLVMGMPHRGRLNVLANVMARPMRKIFQDFTGAPADSEQVLGSGDVKYHMGAECTRTINGKQMDMALCANPSHLEAVNPIVEGRVRCQQWLRGDDGRDRVMAITMHGDAAFAGQGVTAETIAFSGLRFFRTGGTVHIIVNNQIGFTTSPQFARSSRYPSDIAKAVGAPIFHVNGDNPEDVLRVSRLAVEWRMRFKTNAVIDLWCYRKYGHNETDQPLFTQPNMYKLIEQQRNVQEKYREQLLAEGVKEDDVKAVEDKYQSLMKDEFAAARDRVNNKDERVTPWTRLFESKLSTETGVDKATLKSIAQRMTEMPPADFTVNDQLVKVVFRNRRHVVETEANIDWGTAEALALGSLLNEGTSVRMSGQDVERGTFSHRHAVLVDQNREEIKYIPLERVCAPNTQVVVINSSLSEFGVLGFEYGTSIQDPNHLSMWEAQFGDFANGAQTIFDQFLSAGEAKWNSQSGLVCLLPHGYDGQGPEHSSCRLERFLQLTAEHEHVMQSDEQQQLRECNMQVVNASTPAQYFHLLRRQMKRNFRKPLIVASPKKLLRYRTAVSTLDEFATGTSFQWVLPEATPEALVAPEKVRRVLFCSGQVYYDLAEARAAKKIDDTAIVRVEQLSPFPFQRIAEIIGNKYPNAKQLLWVQEEPRNMGAWTYIRPRFHTVLSSLKAFDRNIDYAGRDTAASPATGWSSQHKIELASFVNSALN